jgi:hypothetical protein
MSTTKRVQLVLDYRKESAHNASPMYTVLVLRLECNLREGKPHNTQKSEERERERELRIVGKVFIQLVPDFSARWTSRSL